MSVMHPYSIDTKERDYTLLVLALFSVVLSWLSHKMLWCLKISLPWWGESPSVLLIYGLLLRLFNQKCWRWIIFRKIGLVKTPDLNGEWEGELQTSFDEHTTKKPATLEIFQTWTTMKIRLQTAQSSSYSVAASLVINAPEGKYLSYQYINEPKSDADERMSIHHGTTMLFYNECARTLSGEYYSGRGRQNYGCLTFRKNK